MSRLFCHDIHKFGPAKQTEAVRKLAPPRTDETGADIVESANPSFGFPTILKIFQGKPGHPRRMLCALLGLEAHRVGLLDGLLCVHLRGKAVGVLES